MPPSRATQRNHVALDKFTARKSDRPPPPKRFTIRLGITKNNPTQLFANKCALGFKSMIFKDCPSKASEKIVELVVVSVIELAAKDVSTGLAWVC